MLKHLLGCLAMMSGIDGVEPVGKHANGVDSVLYGAAVGTDINTICQSADDDNVGRQCLHIRHKTADNLLSIVGRLTCSYDADYTLGV